MNPPFTFNANHGQFAAAAAALHRDGIILLTNLLSPEQLQSAQQSFRSRLDRIAWNDLDGYERTELFRLMIEDILLIDQSFVDLVLHPAVLGLVREYVGDSVQSCARRRAGDRWQRNASFTAGTAIPGTTTAASATAFPAN